MCGGLVGEIEYLRILVRLDLSHEVTVKSYTYVESLSGDCCIRQIEVGGEMCYRYVHEPVIVSKFAQSKMQLVAYLYTDVNRCIPSIHVFFSKPSSNVLTANSSRNISTSRVTGVVVVGRTENDVKVAKDYSDLLWFWDIRVYAELDTV